MSKMQNFYLKSQIRDFVADFFARFLRAFENCARIRQKISDLAFEIEILHFTHFHYPLIFMAIEIWSLTLRDTDFGPVGAKLSIPQGEGPRAAQKRQNCADFVISSLTT